MTGAPFTDLTHFSVVTSDLDRAVTAWTDRYGVGPWTKHTFDQSNMNAKVSGTPTRFAFRMAKTQLNPSTYIEIVQPLDSEGPYAAALARHGGQDHVHHVGFAIPDFAEARERFEGLGLDAVLDAEFTGAKPGLTVPAVYFDAPDLGTVIEITMRPDGFQLATPDAVATTT